MLENTLDFGYWLAQQVPVVKGRLNAHVKEEIAKEYQSNIDKLAIERKNMHLIDKMPVKGMSPKEILHHLDIDPDECFFNFDEISANEDWKNLTVKSGDGKDSGALYAVYPKELQALLMTGYNAYALINPIHNKSPRASAMQAEVIAISQRLFHGSSDGYGLITHGGTTSIIEAMAAYVLHARARGVRVPEIVVPETAHTAFKKAAKLTAAKLIVVPVDPATGAVTATEMRKYLSRNCAVMVGSAPSFMDGIHDPIGKLGQLAEEYNIPFHVDSCLGGFLTAFRDTSADPLDFRVRGVTSISADGHKYLKLPKGSSVLLFANHSPAISVYAALNWRGGLYATAGILDGSTCAARAVEFMILTLYFGEERFQKTAANIIQLRERLQTAINQLATERPGDISVFGKPEWSVLGFRSHNINPHLIADEMSNRGWALSMLQKPKGFHMCLTEVHTLIDDFVEQFVLDLRASIIAAKALPANAIPTGNNKTYGVTRLLPSKLQEMGAIAYQKAKLDLQGTFFSRRAVASPGEPPLAITFSASSV